MQPREAYELIGGSYEPNALMRTEQRLLEGWLFPAATALDVGCGTGRYLTLLQAHGAVRLLGVDPARSMLRRVHGFPVVQGCARALPVRSGWAELLVCSLVLGYVEDLAGALLELGRVTRPGGVLLCSEFHPSGAERGWKREFRHQTRRIEIQATAHSLPAWREAAARAGLTLLDLKESALHPQDVPAGARFDEHALRHPVLLALRLRKAL